MSKLQDGLQEMAAAWREMPWSERAEVLVVVAGVLALTVTEISGELVAETSKRARERLMDWRCR